MRTTLDIDDTVMSAARALAEQRGMSLGAAVSHLARRGMAAGPIAQRAGFPVFDATPGHTITDELVAAHRDDE